MENDQDMLLGSRVLITGIAGFIGFSLAKCLLERGHMVIGIDSFKDYADDGLKRLRAKRLEEFHNVKIIEGDICDEVRVRNAFRLYQPDFVVHLAGQAGVRNSLTDPAEHIRSNVLGTQIILETCANISRPSHVLLASSSSVYGLNGYPSRAQHESLSLSRPQSIYAATKIALEALGHAYALNHGVPVSAMRFFTVYGPWGRPDMAIAHFARCIFEDKEITVFGDGEQKRDFTYIDDIVAAIIRLMRAQAPDVFRAVNIGGGDRTSVNELISMMGRIAGRMPRVTHVGAYTDDMRETYADNALLRSLTPWAPMNNIDKGVRIYMDWYANHHGYTQPLHIQPLS